MTKDAILKKIIKELKEIGETAEFGYEFDCKALIKWLEPKLSSSLDEVERETERKWKAFHYVNATPDGNYALRLLQQARADCDEMWSDNTAGVSTDNPLIVEMNRLNKERAKELDKAIALLSPSSEKLPKECLCHCHCKCGGYHQKGRNVYVTPYT